MFDATLERAFSQTLNEFTTRLSAFAPNLLAMLLILATGIVVAGTAHLVVRTLLAAAGFNRLASRSGLSTMVQRGGIVRPPSDIVALLVAWTLLAGFVILAVGALNLQIAVDLLSQAFLYLPRVLIAIAIIILGTLVSAFLRRTVLIAAVNAGLPSARFLAGGTQAAVTILVAAMALEHLGVGRQIIVAAFTILFGGVVFAIALAFGLGAQDLARDLLRRALPPAGREGPTKDTLKHL